MGNYVVMEKIGMGQFNQVMKVQNVNDQQFYVIKLFSSKKLETQIIQTLVENEVAISKLLPKAPYLVNMLESFQEDGYLYLVYEYCEGGSLESKFTEKDFSELEALYILRDIAAGIRLLQHNLLMHRDLKPENIMFSKNYIKIGDFGFATKLIDPNQKLDQTLGTPLYMSP